MGARGRRTAVLVALASIAVASLAGCGLEGPQSVLLIARGADGGYGLHPREIDADDYATLRGDVVEFIARPTVVVVGNVGTIEGGVDLDVEYERSGDHLIPLDYEGLVAVSAYHHINQAAAYFRDVGLPDELERFKTLIQPLTDYGGDVGPYEFHDNAAFMPSIHAFLLLEERWLDYVPLAANEGIIAHEYAHAVFHHVAGPPHPSWDRVSANLWRSINEGLADVHAVALTGDPAFAQASAGRFVFDRDVSIATTALTEELLASAAEELFNPYPIGTVIASVFWDYRDALVAGGLDVASASRAMGELALATTATLDASADGFELEHLVDAVVAVATDQLDAVCTSLRARAALVMSEDSQCR